MVAYCPNCGDELDSDVRYCPECGERVDHRPGPGQSATEESGSRLSRRAYVWIAIVCSAIALVLFPPVFGGIGIFAGYQVHKRGDESSGLILMGAAGVAMVVGALIGLYML